MMWFATLADAFTCPTNPAQTIIKRVTLIP
jgi:hypothetical protein